MSKAWLTLGLFGVRVFGFLSGPWLSDQEIHRVIGEPTRIVRRWDGHAIRVLSWNIERGAEYAAVLGVLLKLDPDILLLQEVDRDCRRTGSRDVARDLAAALGMNWVAAGEFQEIGGAAHEGAAGRGQSIPSNFPIGDADAPPFESQDRWRWSINPVQP